MIPFAYCISMAHYGSLSTCRKSNAESNMISVKNPIGISLIHNPYPIKQANRAAFRDNKKESHTAKHSINITIPSAIPISLCWETHHIRSTNEN